MGDNKISEAAVNEPLQVFSKGTWLYDVTGQQFTSEELDEVAFLAYSPHLQGEAVPVAWQVEIPGKPFSIKIVRREDVAWEHAQSMHASYGEAPDIIPLYTHPQPAELSEQHPDDLAVDTFANEMKSKMTISRWRGRSGWDDRSQCSQSQLSAMLRAHVEKGDPVDVANFCMMLSLRGEGIESAAGLSEVSGGSGELGERQSAWNDSARLRCLESWAREPGGLLLHAESETGRRGLGLGENCGNRTLAQAIDSCATHAEKDSFAALAATGKQQVGEVQGDVVSSIAEFLKERDESLAPGEATDSERVVSARIIASLNAVPGQVSIGEYASFECWAKESANLDISKRHGKYRDANTFCASLAWQAAIASRQPEAEQGIDLGPLRRLYQAYVRLLESGRDRITDLGGACDPVDVMERMDVDLIEARNLLGIKIDGRDAGAGVGS